MTNLILGVVITKEPKKKNSAINTSYLTNRTKQINYKQHEENSWMCDYEWTACAHICSKLNTSSLQRQPSIPFVLLRIRTWRSITLQFILMSVLKFWSLILFWWAGCCFFFFKTKSVQMISFKPFIPEIWFYITSLHEELVKATTA